MPELNKWQVREAEQYAKDNDITRRSAVEALFPDGVPDGVPDEPEGDDVKGDGPETKAPAGTKTSVKK